MGRSPLAYLGMIESVKFPLAKRLTRRTSEARPLSTKPPGEARPAARSRPLLGGTVMGRILDSLASDHGEVAIIVLLGLGWLAGFLWL